MISQVLRAEDAQTTNLINFMQVLRLNANLCFGTGPNLIHYWVSKPLIHHVFPSHPRAIAITANYTQHT